MRNFVVLALVVLAGCIAEPEVSGPQLYSDNCAVCHGVDGKGGGPAGLGQPVAPPDLTGLTARNNGVFPRDYVMSTIDGYTRDSHFGAGMPTFGDGDLGEVVIVENADGTGTPVPVDLLSLADYLESIQR